MLHDTPTHKKHCSLDFVVCRCYQPVYTRVGTSKSFFFKSVKFTWKIRNQLNRKKNQILDFSDFYFLSYGHFGTKLSGTKLS